MKRGCEESVSVVDDDAKKMKNEETSVVCTVAIDWDSTSESDGQKTEFVRIKFKNEQTMDHFADRQFDGLLDQIEEFIGKDLGGASLWQDDFEMRARVYDIECHENYLNDYHNDCDQVSGDEGKDSFGGEDSKEGTYDREDESRHDELKCDDAVDVITDSQREDSDSESDAYDSPADQTAWKEEEIKDWNLTVEMKIEKGSKEWLPTFFGPIPMKTKNEREMVKLSMLNFKPILFEIQHRLGIKAEDMHEAEGIYVDYNSADEAEGELVDPILWPVPHVENEDSSKVRLASDEPLGYKIEMTVDLNGNVCIQEEATLCVLDEDHMSQLKRENFQQLKEVLKEEYDSEILQISVRILNPIRYAGETAVYWPHRFNFNEMMHPIEEERDGGSPVRHAK